MNFLTLFVTISGYIIGLGAVTVIDMLGFLGRKSPYWTEATTRAHKVTKPLIWIGMVMAFGGGLFYYSENYPEWLVGHAGIFMVLILNGLFLSFYVSPYLLKQEKEGNASKLLPDRLQYAITGSFIISFIGWWSSFVLLVYSITT